MTADPTVGSETRRQQAETVVRDFLRRADKDADAAPEVALFADGLGLDSLETAELSAVLEDAFGEDPFSTGDMPATLGDALGFYGS